MSKTSAGKRKPASGNRTGRKNAAAGRKKTVRQKAAGKNVQERNGLRQEQSAFFGREALFLFLCLAAAFLFLSNFGLLGKAGKLASGFQKGLFGAAAYIFPVYLVFACVSFFRDRYDPLPAVKIAALLLMPAVTAALIHLLVGSGQPLSFRELYENGAAGDFYTAAGGAAGGSLAGILSRLFAGIGASLILSALLILCLVIVTGKSFISVARSGAVRARSAALKGGRAAKEHLSEEKVRFEARREAAELRRKEEAARLSSGAVRRPPESPLFDLKAERSGMMNAYADRLCTEGQQKGTDGSCSPEGYVSLKKENSPGTPGFLQTPEKVPSETDSSAMGKNPMRFHPEGESYASAKPLSAGGAYPPEEPDYLTDSVPFEETPAECYRSYGKMFAGGTVTAEAAGRMGYAVTRERSHELPQPGQSVNARTISQTPLAEKGSVSAQPFYSEGIHSAEIFQDPEPAAATPEEAAEPYLHRPADPEEIRYPEYCEPAQETEEAECSGTEPDEAEKENDPDGSPDPGPETEEEERRIRFSAERYYSAEPVRTEERCTEENSRRTGRDAGNREKQSADSLNRRSEDASGKPHSVSADRPVRRRPYQFPPVSLLAKGVCSEGSDLSETRDNARKLERVLAEFGVGVTVTNVVHGPRVTRYEMIPDTGVKVSRITALSDDLKLALAARELRVEAPIPGKSAVGIEVPNHNNSMVTFRDIMDTAEFRQSKSKLSWGVGLDIQGSPVIGDIAKMPHLLVSGTTGSGKSVGINSIIMSVIYRASPEEVRLILVDPKVVELSVYDGIPHLLAPVVTKPDKALAVLNKACAEMQRRYALFKESNTRNISGYNEKAEEAAKRLPAGMEPPEKLPYILIIIDELSELMMHAKKDVESSIVSLTQLARAAGIHLVVATQRPSVDVVTGLIKSNIPSRVAYRLPSGTDSRTILDSYGAETLLGNGDMLYKPGDKNSPLRVQGAYLSDTEVESVVSWLRKHNTSVYEDEWENVTVRAAVPGEGGGSADTEYTDDGRDEYFREAGEFITEKKKASIGMLQRKFKVGFNRASRIMDQLNEAGVVSDGEGTKERQILLSAEEFREKFENGGI